MEKLGKQLLLFDFFIGRFAPEGEEFRKEKYRGERIYQIGPEREMPAAFFIRGNDVHFATDIALAREAIDRLATDVSDQQTSELQRRLAALPADNLRGVVSNVDGEVDLLLAGMSDWIRDQREEEEDAALAEGGDEAAVDAAAVDGGSIGGLESPEDPNAELAGIELDSGIQWVEVRGGFPEARDFRVQFAFTCQRSGCEGSDLPERVEEWRSRTDDSQIVIEYAVTPTAQGMDVVVTARDLIGWIEKNRSPGAAGVEEVLERLGEPGRGAGDETGTPSD